MLSPDLIADQALILTSQWQRETSQERGNRLLYRDQARRWAQQGNNQDQYGATLDAVRGIMGSDQHV